ncbi:DUF2780 domain-containing protein [Planctomycetes bacterium K23_9]|uniref:DUF2780 domain-containing protein n=1 Tax=Stieleria marina TaxID=1930275 RepID=A0A517NS07_9BACT|nr:hypothetical protein K239x_18380 [Planctomycetes bacterium K23_9]
MDELIQQLTSKLGIDASTANAATGKAMAMVKEHAGEDLFNKISGAIPGASDAAVAAESEQAAGSDGGGLMGSLTGMASGLLGDKAGDALGMAASLKSAGLNTDQFGGFASTIVEFIQDKVGDDVMKQILDKVPMLKSLMG